MIKEEMKIGPKGQVVIPKMFRKHLGMHPGTGVMVGLEDNTVIISKIRRDIVADFERIAKSGKSIRINPHEYEEELENRWKRSKK
jgi:AbrB family looped-hinge helix DNA binding protein